VACHPWHMTDNIWLTAEEAAERLGCSVRTIWRMAARGEIPTIHKPRDRRTWFGIESVQPCPTCGCLCSGRDTDIRRRSREAVESSP
jgi:excisionase family DNA binding protein